MTSHIKSISAPLLLLSVVLFAQGEVGNAQPARRKALISLPSHTLRFNKLAPSWDEGIPLGNGMMGALIWQRDSVLRMSLDRADLWDLRPVKEFERPEFRFSWVVDQALHGDYQKVHEMGDVPYDRDAAPTKLPGAALEFPVKCGEVESVELRLANAVCTVRWKGGETLETFVNAEGDKGWFRFKGMPSNLRPKLIPPPYSLPDTSSSGGNSGPGGNDLRRLGYPPPGLEERDLGNSKQRIRYHQQCWNGFSYDVETVTWREADQLIGYWTIQPSKPFTIAGVGERRSLSPSASSFPNDLAAHTKWWEQFWKKSALSLPDSVLERQWYLEMYKFGSASRRGAPPITLQAVWTADNSRLPPWKGDFHHDLNTQLSYWPCYSGNHLEEGLSFLDWLWWCKPTAERYTLTYFGTKGLAFPGVSTLTGEPMGGWIQYSLSPTVSAWLGQHFYLHWRYSMDSKFLRERAYPWIRAVAEHIDQLSVRDEKGRKKLPLSASPEINDNRVEAWFRETTNYDLSLIRWLYSTAAELALELGDKKDAARWKTILIQWPDLALDQGGKLLVAPGYPLKESHRHFSHLMSIHPLGLLDWDRGEADKGVIAASLSDLERLGPDLWCGYSYAWLGSMWARARNGEKAAEALRVFSSCFCLPNSFHANGDQSRSGKSKFTYRPFTLEGNFACAQGIQEMLIQSHNGILRIFPALPKSWTEVSFTELRAEGALVVSAARQGGRTYSVTVSAERGGHVRMMDPFAGERPLTRMKGVTGLRAKGGFIEFDARPGGAIELVLQ